MGSSKWDEAERRIEEARKTGATSLDLGDLGLGRLPKSLGDLEGLQRLSLGKFKLKDEGKGEWDFQRPTTHLADLAPLRSLRSLRFLDVSFSQVQDLGPLSSHSNLNSLYVRFSQVQDLGPLSSLSNLNSLSVSTTQVQNLGPLSSLSNLNSLDVSSTPVQDLGPLSSHSNLNSLDVSFSQVQDLGPLSSLSNLNSLDVSFSQVQDLGPLSSLSNLNSLSVSGTPVQDLGPLSSHSNLNSLSVSSTPVQDLGPLSSLSNLNSLYVSETPVQDLGPLSSLSNLNSLYVSETPVQDLSPLSSLSNLNSLYVRSTQVQDLGPLSSLSNLNSLYVSGTPVQDLGPLSSLSNLNSLYVSGTPVQDLGPLSSLMNLNSLDVWKVQRIAIEVLQRILASNPRLRNLVCAEVESVPSEVLSSHGSDNCLSRLRSYLAEVEGETADETEIKVVLLGNGRVGKTQLCRRLRGEKADFDLASTHGVELWREELTLQAGGETKTYWINWWDFGGQDIYHGTHALFLRTRAIFLLLWHPDYENTEEYEDHGIPMRNQPLAYWLDYIRSLAGPNSPVILVQSQCETFAQEKALPMQPEGFDFVRPCAFAAANDHGRESLETHLREAIRYLREKTGDLKIGKARAEVRNELFAMRDEDRDRPSDKKEHQTLSVETFQALCKKIGGIHSWQHALDYFHQSGVVFYQSNTFRDRIVLDQSWALDAIYTVFHRSSTLPVFREHGAFSRLELEALIWQDRSLEEQRLFLSMMESCGICFQYRKTAGEEEEPIYLAPDLLPPFDRVRSRLAPWQEDAEILTLRVDYRFLHQTILRNLLSQLGSNAREAATYWKYGLYLYDRNSRSQLWVREERPGQLEGLGAGAVVLQAQGQDPARLLREAYRSFRQQNFAEQPEVSLTCGGETVVLAAFEHLADGRVCTVDGRWVAAQPFRFLEDPRAQEGTMPERRPRIDAGSIEDSAPDRQIFISYAWGDPTEEGKVREEAVQHLYQALVDDGYRVIRDREELMPGDSIRDFMDRLAKGAHVVCVISDRYLRSANCMYELYRIWQRCGSDRRELAERIVPVILSQVEISDFLQRAPYLKHWKQKKDAFETLFRDPDLLPSAESLREVRLVREFAGTVDEILVFVNDILMPRNLGEHLDDGFQPVRELLRKRLS